FNRIVRGFAFDQASPLADRVKNAPAAECPACANLRGGLLFAGGGGAPRGLFEPDLDNFQFRIGFAYTLSYERGWLKGLFGDKHSVIRGGYGRYFHATGKMGSQTGFFVPTNYIANDLSGRVGIPELGVNTFSKPFPNGVAAAPGASAGLLTQPGQGLSYDNP